MRTCVLILVLFRTFLPAQTIQDCRKRFEQNLNFHDGLSQRVRFENAAVHICSANGTPEISVYENELMAVSAFLTRSSFASQSIFWSKKGRKKLSQGSLDSLLKLSARDQELHKIGNASFQALRVAIDPGHFSTNMKDAASEQKYLCFKVEQEGFPYDSVKLFESALTFNTAQLLKSMLEERGAEVMLSRDMPNHSSFGCSYGNWFMQHKTRVLDSLVHCGKLSASREKALLKLKPYNFFWEFFRDFDLQNRASKINAFSPDITLIIHYNVDEKNAPWTGFSKKDFTMAFIGGVFLPEHLGKSEMRLNFLRLLFSNQLDESARLSAHTVKAFHKNLGIPVATQGDAKYLHENCMPLPGTGVYSRNLLMCRQVNSVLVYGEALYQDNPQEAAALMRRDMIYKGIVTNDRLIRVARSYFEGLEAYLKDK
ncbi:MAG TPA: N-acetylmuramoyl-L-alanine amidase [Bacteroidia bacterium]|nr:N-acetylmuramoyl-L-alanine amidase [Bacteroidia bacterium]